MLSNHNGAIIHPNATVADSAKLYDGTVVWSGAVVGHDVQTGPGCVVGSTKRERHNAAAHRWRKANPEKRRASEARYKVNNSERLKARQRAANEVYKLRALQHYAGGPSETIACACCGEPRLPFLTLDHIDGNGAEHRRQNKANNLSSWLCTHNFPWGYQILCWNCNCAKGTKTVCPHKTERNRWPNVKIGNAQIHQTVQIEPGSVIWDFTIIGEKVVIGKDCVIGSHCYIGKGVQIGNGTHLQTGVFIPNNTIIGAKVFLGPSVVLCDDKHPSAGNANYKAEPPVLEDHTSIGARATILPGVKIGYGAIVGAGAVVTRDVESCVTVIGNPAFALSALASPKEEAMLKVAHKVWQKYPIKRQDLM